MTDELPGSIPVTVLVPSDDPGARPGLDHRYVPRDAADTVADLRTAADAPQDFHAALYVYGDRVEELNDSDRLDEIMETVPDDRRFLVAFHSSPPGEVPGDPIRLHPATKE